MSGTGGAGSGSRAGRGSSPLSFSRSPARILTTCPAKGIPGTFSIQSCKAARWKRWMMKGPRRSG